MSVFPTGDVTAAAVPALRPTRVLVVDDDGLQLRALQRKTRDHKAVDVTAIDNAIDALLAIGTNRPDLVVMDVFMPGLDGIEACRRIKANPQTRDITVVLASAAMTDEIAEAARAVGAAQVVSKPIDVVALAAQRDLVSSEATNGPKPPARFPSGTIAPPIGAAPSTATLATGSASIALPSVDVEPAPTMRGADLLVSMLEDAGVDVVFGIPGGAISPVHDALLDSKIRVVTTRHEAGAMFAAAAHARATGNLAVVAVTSGPGVLNSMTGLATAWCDGVPVLLLVGEVPRAAHGKGVLQDGSAHGLQIVEMSRHVAKLALEVPRASTLPHLARRAITTALSGRRGPVVMTLPLDVTTAQVQRPRACGSLSMGTTIDPASLDELAEILRTARRPLILAGNGMRADGAPAHLLTLAERLGCPVATTPKGKGVFPETHALALGVLGLGGHPSTRAYLEKGVDVLLAIGTSLGDMSTDGFSPLLQTKTFIHVDIDARQVGKSYSPTHAIVASAADFLGGLAGRLGERTVEGATPTLARGVERHRLPSSTKPDRIASHDAINTIQDLLPRDTIYTVDSGEHFLFAAHYLRTTHPDSFLVMTGLGSMGQSIPAAIGAQLADRTRTVATICGDGCFAMNAFEVATAVAENLPLRVFVFNDQRLGMVENGHGNVYGRKPSYPTDPLDVCLVAQGLGATTLRVSSAADLLAAREILRTTPGPVVVDVRIDPDISLPKLDRVAAMKQPSGSNAFGISAPPADVN